MQYRLDELTKLARECGLESRRVDADRLDVTIQDGCILAFCNLLDNTLVGFEETPWHSHGIVQFGTGGATYVECDELAILIGVGSGELVVASNFLDSRLSDRWLAHRREPLNLEYMEPAGEMRVLRLRALGSKQRECGNLVNVLARNDNGARRTRPCAAPITP